MAYHYLVKQLWHTVFFFVRLLKHSIDFFVSFGGIPLHVCYKWLIHLNLLVGTHIIIFIALQFLRKGCVVQFTQVVMGYHSSFCAAAAV